MIIIKKIKLYLTDNYFYILEKELSQYTLKNVFCMGYIKDYSTFKKSFSKLVTKYKLNNSIFKKNITIYTHYFKKATREKIKEEFINNSFQKVIVKNKPLIKIDSQELLLIVLKKYTIINYQKKIYRIPNNLFQEKKLLVNIANYISNSLNFKTSFISKIFFYSFKKKQKSQINVIEDITKIKTFYLDDINEKIKETLL